MPKKRSMPHHRSMPKAKKDRVRIFTPTPMAPEQTQGNGSSGPSLTATPSPTPASSVPRSAVRGYSPRARAASTGGTGLVTDYAYVAADLKRIGIIAGSILVILVILAFVIR